MATLYVLEHLVSTFRKEDTLTVYNATVPSCAPVYFMSEMNALAELEKYSKRIRKELTVLFEAAIIDKLDETELYQGYQFDAYYPDSEVIKHEIYIRTITTRG